MHEAGTATVPHACYKSTTLALDCNCVGTRLVLRKASLWSCHGPALVVDWCYICTLHKDYARATLVRSRQLVLRDDNTPIQYQHRANTAQQIARSRAGSPHFGTKHQTTPAPYFAPLPGDPPIALELKYPKADSPGLPNRILPRRPRAEARPPAPWAEPWWASVSSHGPRTAGVWRSSAARRLRHRSGLGTQDNRGCPVINPASRPATLTSRGDNKSTHTCVCASACAPPSTIMAT